MFLPSFQNVYSSYCYMLTVSRETYINFAKIEETDGTDDLKTVFYRFEISCIVIMLQSGCEFESTSTQSFSVTVCV